MNSVATAIIVGTTLSGILVYLGLAILLRSERCRRSGSKGVIERRAAWLIAILTYPFAWFVGLILGGNFGGGYAGWLSERTGIAQEVLIPIAVGAGIVIVTSVVDLGIALSGFVAIRHLAKKCQQVQPIHGPD